MMKNLILIKLKLIAVFVCFRKDSLDKDLFNKCKKIKYNISNLDSIKYFLSDLSETKKALNE